MNRLTSNKDVSEMGMFELAHNSCYVKDGNARYRDYDLDIDARELTRKLLKEYADGDDAFCDDDDFDEQMVDYLQYGFDIIEGLIALFYRNLWAMADLWEELKEYEDLEKQGKLLKLPCAVGDTIYIVLHNHKIKEAKVVGFKMIAKGWAAEVSDWSYLFEEFGKSVFLTKEQAEAALNERKSKSMLIFRQRRSQRKKKRRRICKYDN